MSAEAKAPPMPHMIWVHPNGISCATVPIIGWHEYIIASAFPPTRWNPNTSRMEHYHYVDDLKGTYP